MTLEFNVFMSDLVNARQHGFPKCSSSLELLTPSFFTNIPSVSLHSVCIGEGKCLVVLVVVRGEGEEKEFKGKRWILKRRGEENN